MEEASEYLIGASSWDFAKPLLLLKNVELCSKQFFFVKTFGWKFGVKKDDYSILWLVGDYITSNAMKRAKITQ